MAPNPEQQRRLDGKVAVVTGAGAGIGQGVAAMFAAQGAKVYALDIDETLLADAVASTRASIIPLTVDILDELAVTNAIDSIGRENGKIDVLVTAAAVSLFYWIEEMEYEYWTRTLKGELDIVFLITRAAWPYLKKSEKASVINFASVNAYAALNGSPALAHCAGKGGVLSMTRQLAMEGAPHGIRCNSISPGLIRTKQTMKHMAMDPAFEGEAMKRVMIKRIGLPEDIAWCATWLASDEASYVTGADISVDGGATAW